MQITITFIDTAHIKSTTTLIARITDARTFDCIALNGLRQSLQRARDGPAERAAHRAVDAARRSTPATGTLVLRAHANCSL